VSYDYSFIDWISAMTSVFRVND